MTSADRFSSLPRGGSLSAEEIIAWGSKPTSRAGGQNLSVASAQWANRPPDERFLSLDDLQAFTEQRQYESDEFPDVDANDLRVQYLKEGPHANALYAVDYEGVPAVFTNWSFQQYNSVIGGPDLRWLRRMPAPVSAMALNSSIEFRDYAGPAERSERVKLLVAPPKDDQPGTLRAVTGPDYGRIWDAEIVRTIQLLNDRGQWVVPGKIAGKGWADGYEEVTKQSTTLYASDRDMWVFLVDEQHPIEIDGETYFRGIIISNSEVGDAKFRVTGFYCLRVCCNRTIWDAIALRELSIRHSRLAPQKFLEQAVPAIAAYSNASVAPVVEAFRKARATSIPSEYTRDIDGAEKFLRDQGFNQAQSKVIPILAERAQEIGSSGDPTSIYDLLQGATAYARELVYADKRVEFEKQAGMLLERFVRIK